mmetsp:Transcript_8853/g.16946  ORF Transcript_8853/g.16946 Transcript_8853/m.16946 type:complete len:117 (-) Transcript_8853:248-598(-)
MLQVCLKKTAVAKVAGAAEGLEVVHDVVERHRHCDVCWRLAASNGLGEPCNIASIGLQLACGNLAPSRRAYKCCCAIVAACQCEAETVASATTDTGFLDNALCNCSNGIQACNSPW